MDGDLDDSAPPPAPTPAEKQPASTDTGTDAIADAGSDAASDIGGDASSGKIPQQGDRAADKPPANTPLDAADLLVILPADTEADPDKSGLTIPRSFGVWQLPAKTTGKRYRFGNYPIRGKELGRDFGKATLVKLYTSRPAAKAHADKLN